MSHFWRRLRFGAATLLGVRRLGFFIPYRYAQSVEPLDYPALRPLFEAAQPRFSRGACGHREPCRRSAPDPAGKGPARFDQSWFPRLDAAAAYAIVRREKPARIVEIGSGHSTRFMAQAVRDGGFPPASPASIPRRGRA